MSGQRGSVGRLLCSADPSVALRAGPRSARRASDDASFGRSLGRGAGRRVPGVGLHLVRRQFSAGGGESLAKGPRGRRGPAQQGLARQRRRVRAFDPGGREGRRPPASEHSVPTLAERLPLVLAGARCRSEHQAGQDLAGNALVRRADRGGTEPRSHRVSDLRRDVVFPGTTGEEHPGAGRIGLAAHPRGPQTRALRPDHLFGRRHAGRRGGGTAKPPSATGAAR